VPQRRDPGRSNASLIDRGTVRNMDEARPAPLTLAGFFAVALIGGSNVVAVRLSNRELDPMWGAGLRFTAASILLLVIVAVARLGLPRGRALGGAVLYGLFNIFGFFSLAYFALQPRGVSSALGGVMLGMVPLLTLILAIVQRLEPFRARSLIGAIIALAGVAVMLGAPSNRGVAPIYVLAMFAAAVCAAQASVVVKRVPPVHPIAMNAVAMTTSAPLLLAVSLIAGDSWKLPEERTTWLTLAYIIPIGSVALFAIFVYVLHKWTATGVSYQFVLFPIVAALVGAWIADEELSVSIGVGAALAIAGVYIGALSGARSSVTPEPADLPA
jgi:drug/metabolite transporter (DMT)-like permease